MALRIDQELSGQGARRVYYHPTCAGIVSEQLLQVVGQATEVEPWELFQAAWGRLPQAAQEAADAWRVQIEAAETLPALADVVARLNANKMSVKQAMPALSHLAVAKKEHLEETAAHEAESREPQDVSLF